MNKEKINYDSKGNVYLELENIRISFVKSSKRISENDWPGCDVLRIQAYRGEGKSLHMGAELPIKSKDDIIELVDVLVEIYRLIS